MSDKSTVVGYIGLGHAGYPLAANIPRAGYRIIVRDADPERAEKFAKENPNSEVATPGKEAFKDVDILITMLPNGKVVRDVLLGDEGVAKALKPGEKYSIEDGIGIITGSGLFAEIANRGLDIRHDHC